MIVNRQIEKCGEFNLTKSISASHRQEFRNRIAIAYSRYLYLYELFQAAADHVVQGSQLLEYKFTN